MRGVVGYIFRADLYCPAHIGAAVAADARYDGWALAPGAAPMTAEADLDEIAVAFGIDRHDETSFDSDDFPKVVFAHEAADDAECVTCGEALR